MTMDETNKSKLWDNLTNIVVCFREMESQDIKFKRWHDASIEALEECARKIFTYYQQGIENE